MGGNFGTPLAQYVCELKRGARKKAKYLILELSSYQLENFNNLNCDCSVITFLSSNHLERYSTKEEYYETKLSLLNKTKGFCFINSESVDLVENIKKRNNAKIVMCNPTNVATKLIGPHNKQNVSLAIAVAKHYNWGATAMDSISNFCGLPHRIENLGKHKGVLFINDSKSTTIDSTITAIKTCLEITDKNNVLHVLLGGKDKNLPWKQLQELKTTNNCQFYFFGQSASIAKKSSGLIGEEFSKLKDAVDSAFACSKKNDVVLLSPGGASQDEFKNFEERGNYFKNLIEQL